MSDKWICSHCGHNHRDCVESYVVRFGDEFRPIQKRKVECYERQVANLEAENKAMREWMEAFLEYKHDYLEERGWNQNVLTGNWTIGCVLYPCDELDAMCIEAKRILGGE
jgi:hypothetical protein